MNYTIEGEKLLKLFRTEQEKRGNIGCICSECSIDMINALQKLFGVSS